METGYTKRFSFLCDNQGNIIKVFHAEGIDIAENCEECTFFSLVAGSDRIKAMDFFVDIKQHSSSSGWEINIETGNGPETFSLLGGQFGDLIGIAASTFKDDARILMEDLSRINSEQTNMIRALLKENSSRSGDTSGNNLLFYDELSSLNNELVNMQRELAKKNVELAELNRLKNKFLGMAAHDLRSPIGVVMGYTGFILEDDQGRLSEDQRTMLESVVASSEFMLGLLNDLLDVSAIESGNINLRLEKSNIVDLVRKTVDLNNVIALKKGTRITYVCEEQLPEVLFDKIKIEQVLNNLISNAVKYSQPGSKIIVTTEIADKSMIVSVEDNGQGIPTAEIDNLFKPFQKTSVRSTAGESSTGLGLSITKNLVEAHNGKIWVNSSEGKGSTFYFTIPLDR